MLDKNEKNIIFSLLVAERIEDKINKEIANSYLK